AVDHRIWEGTNQSPADVTEDRGVHFRHRRDAVKHGLNVLREPDSQAGVLLLVPVERLVEVGACLATKDHRQAHRPARLRAAVLTSSQEITSSGDASSSARRRWISAICSSVNSGSWPWSRSPVQISSMRRS